MCGIVSCTLFPYSFVFLQQLTFKMPKLGKVMKKTMKVAKKAVKKAANDPEVKALAKNTARQLKQQFLAGIKTEMSAYSGGRITGNGDYYVSKNVHGKVSGRALSVANSIVIEREEFITPVISGAAKATTIQKYRVNPGNYLLMPWGSAVALGYESWEPLGIQIIFDSTSGTALNSTDTSLGKASLAAQYNTYARDWDSFLELENANDSITKEPCENMLLGIEAKQTLRGAKTLYVSATDPNSAGKGFYDLCDVYVATTGLQGANVRCGDLKIRYRIRLFNPIVRDSQIPISTIQANGTNASANDSLAVTPTVVENMSTKLGASLAWTANTLVISKLPPFVGKMRLTLQLQKGTTSGTRNGATCTFTGSYLGNAVTVANDSPSIDQGYPAASETATVQGYSASKIYPVETDTITITFTGGTGVSGDTFGLLVVLSSAESSDF